MCLFAFRSPPAFSSPTSVAPPPWSQRVSAFWPRLGARDRTCPWRGRFPRSWAASSLTPAPAQLGEGVARSSQVAGSWSAGSGVRASETRHQDAFSPPQVHRGVARAHLPLLRPLVTKTFADPSRSGGNLVFEELLEVRSNKNIRTFPSKRNEEMIVPAIPPK